MGVHKYRYGKVEEKETVGLATGLAWTEQGGDLLVTEVAILPGKGKLIITGKLGDVMQESAQAALTYVRSRGRLLDLDEEDLRASAINNSASCWSFDLHTALHPPAHISICTGGCAL